MFIKKFLLNLFVGCGTWLLLDGSAQALNQVLIIPGQELLNRPLDFIIRTQSNVVICQATGIKLAINTPAIPCPQLSTVTTPQKLLIVIGPDTTTRCAPASKPISFDFTPGKNVVINPKSITMCTAVSQ